MALNDLLSLGRGCVYNVSLGDNLLLLSRLRLLLCQDLLLLLLLNLLKRKKLIFF